MKLTFNKVSCLLLVGVMCFVVTGCSAKKVQPSGFLSDYYFMEKGEPIEKELFIDKPHSEYSGQYSKVIVEPVIIYFHKDAVGTAVEPDKLKELANFFYIEIVGALKDNYEIVETDGPGVVKLKVAITDVIKNKPLLNIHWSTTLAGFGLGGASMEAEAFDTETRKRIFAIVDSRIGKRSIKTYTKGWKKWGHTEDILHEWAGLLAAQLQDL